MKKFLSGICILVVMLSFKIDNAVHSEDNGTLSVVASVRDAYTSMVQADAGCEIYAVNESDLKADKNGDLKMVIERFQGYKYDYLVSTHNLIDAAVNSSMRDNFDTLCAFTGKYISGFRKLPGIVRVVTNGSGHAELNLRPGKYYLLVISGTVKSNNTAELRGNIGYKIVEIKTALETIQNVCFQKYEMTGIMMARNLSGC